MILNSAKHQLRIGWRPFRKSKHGLLHISKFHLCISDGPLVKRLMSLAPSTVDFKNVYLGLNVTISGDKPLLTNLQRRNFSGNFSFVASYSKTCTLFSSAACNTSNGRIICGRRERYNPIFVLGPGKPWNVNLQLVSAPLRTPVLNLLQCFHMVAKWTRRVGRISSLSINNYLEAPDVIILNNDTFRTF